MGSAHANMIIHVVFSTKHRAPMMTGEVQQLAHRCLARILEQRGLRVLAVGGTEDHVHLLVRLPPAVALSDAIRAAKGSTSAVVNRRSDPDLTFAWQAGFGAFSVSEHMVPRVIGYIRHQARHHHGLSSAEEYDQFLEQNGIDPEQPAQRS